VASVQSCAYVSGDWCAPQEGGTAHAQRGLVGQPSVSQLKSATSFSNTCCLPLLPAILSPSGLYSQKQLVSQVVVLFPFIAACGALVVLQ
jgi:hypothetical protein